MSSAADPGSESTRKLERTRLLLCLGVVVALLAVIGATYRDYGISWDEKFYLDMGGVYLGRFFDMPSLAERQDIWEHLRTHGALVDAVYRSALYALGRGGSFESLHLVKALFSALALLPVYWMLCRVAPRGLAPVAGALLLVFSPAWLGHIFDNHMDGSSTLLYALQMAFALRLLAWSALFDAGTARALGRVLGFAVLAGVAFSHRIPLLLVPAVYFLLLLRQVGGRERLARAAGVVAVFGVGFVATLYVVDPYIRTNPATGFFERVWFAADADVVNRMQVLFDGQLVRSADLPRRYLVQWMAMSIPTPTLLLLGVGLARLALSLSTRGDRARRLEAAFLLSTLLLPVLIVSVVRPVLFDAWRHFLFLTVPIVVIAAIGLDWLCERAGPRGRWSLAIVFGASLVTIGLGMARLHPYEYVYANALAGGLPGLEGRYEIDYWAKSHKEAAEWVARQPRADPGRRSRVFTCGPTHSVAYYLPGSFVVTRELAGADWVICVVRGGFVPASVTGDPPRRRPLRRPPDHTVERDGVALTRIWKLTERDAGGT